MSPNPAARAARALIARSNRLLFDTNDLRYIAGLAKPEVVEPAAVKDLLDAGELEVISVSKRGVVNLELTEEAFRRGVNGLRRSKGPNRRIEAAQFYSASASGIGGDGQLLDGGLVATIMAIPMTNTLFSRLLTATQTALQAYNEDPRRVGLTVRTPGHLTPLKMSSLRDNPLDIMGAFEDADLNVMINAANGLYSFGTMAHGYWLSTESRTIHEFVIDMLDRFGKRASSSVMKSAEQILKSPLIRERSIHPDEENEDIMEAIRLAEEYDDEEAA